MPALRSVRLRSPSFGWCACLGALVFGAASCSENRGEPATSSGGMSAGIAGASGASGVAGALGGSAGGGTAGAGAASSSGAGGTTSGGAGATGGIGTGGGGASGSAGSTGGVGTSGNSGVAGNAGTAGNSGTSGSSGVGGSAGEGGGEAGAGSGSAGEGGEAGGSNDDYQPCPHDGSPCKILPFGDSITDGFGTGGAYRVELFRRAHQAGKNLTFVGTGSNGPATVDGVSFPANHEGHSGFTIDPTPSRSGISPLVGSVIPQFTPHVVTLMIGTNDCIDDYQLANAPGRLGALIDSIYQRLPDVLIVVAQPIPSREDPLNSRIQSYNAAIPGVVQARAEAGRHIRLVDMYAPFVAVADYKTSLLKDTWHPNEAGHAILGERWYSALADVL